MRPIITITLNPALDLSTHSDTVEPGPKLRCEEPQRDPGGGGINVSRVVTELGGTTTPFVALGGGTGIALQRLLRRDLPNLAVQEIDGETRQSLSVTEATSGKQYRFVMPGPMWDMPMAEAALTVIRKVTPAGALVVFSGSLPPGVTDDFPIHLCEVLSNCDVILDMSGGALRTFASSGTNAFVLRMDMGEGAALHGSPLESVKETADFASGLVRAKAAETVIIARGAEGSVLADAGGATFVNAAKVTVDSKVGAGDSFVGAYVYALADGQPSREALRLGAAAASAAVTTPATELCHKEAIVRLLDECQTSEIKA